MSNPSHLNPGPDNSVSHQHLKGVRAVAALEFTKGVLAVMAGLGLLSLLHKDLSDVAESLLDFLHIDPDYRYAQVFLDLADRLNDGRLWLLAAVALAYAALRFVEAYGLWRARPWAEWLAFASGAVYLPFEVFELVRRPTLVHAGILIVNLVVVLYMLYLRTGARAREQSAYQQAE